MNQSINPLEEPKPAIQSKTMVGAVSVVAAFLLQQAGIDVEVETLNLTLMQLAEGAGGLLTIFGLRTAEKPISGVLRK